MCLPSLLLLPVVKDVFKRLSKLNNVMKMFEKLTVFIYSVASTMTYSTPIGVSMVDSIKLPACNVKPIFFSFN